MDVRAEKIIILETSFAADGREKIGDIAGTYMEVNAGRKEIIVTVEAIIDEPE